MRATFRLETGNGTSSLWLKNNNAGGIKCGDMYCSYPTKKIGMRALRELLKNYVEKYGFNYKQIRKIYCECGEEDYYKFMKILEEKKEK